MKYRNCKQRNPASQQNYSNSCKINCLPGNAKMKVDFFFFRKKKKQPYKNRSYRSLNLRKLIRCLGIGSNKNWGRWTTRLGLDCGKRSTVECVRGGRVPYTGWRVSTTCHLVHWTTTREPDTCLFVFFSLFPMRVRQIPNCQGPTPFASLIH